MRKKIEPKEIAKGNPRVDLNKLREGIKLSKKLEESGFVKRGYELPAPYARKRAEIAHSLPDEPLVLRSRNS